MSLVSAKPHNAPLSFLAGSIAVSRRGRCAMRLGLPRTRTPESAMAGLVPRDSLNHPGCPDRRRE